MSKSEDLFDNIQVLGFEDYSRIETCMICNGQCIVNYEGELEPSDQCTGECGELPQPDDYNMELNFE